ncbi:MAG: class I SAM-dependent methyltransferase [Pseudonocardiaceae bacterium]
MFDNDSVHAREQHQCLAEMLDPMTTARLARLGVSGGWNCLELGAGGGSVAGWLARRVAPTGRVLATDIKPTHITPAPCLQVQRHDAVRDPLPEGAFDLIYARLVLLHLPERLAVLDKLARALRPGGWLQLDEFDISYGPGLLMPNARARELYESFLAAKIRVMDSASADGAWGQRVPLAMQDAGLVDIDTEVGLQLWRAGSPGTRLLIHHTYHLREKFLAAGMTDEQLADVREVMADPAFRATSCAIYSVQGRRPQRAG